MSQITLDLDALMKNGQIDDAEAARLKGFALPEPQLPEASTPPRLGPPNTRFHWTHRGRVGPTAPTGTCVRKKTRFSSRGCVARLCESRASRGAGPCACECADA